MNRGGEAITQDNTIEPIVNDTHEGEIDGISDDEFLKSIGVNPEMRSEVLSDLESYFGNRVFHYGQYSGTIDEMQKCPVFYDKLEEGFEAAASWLLEYDEAQVDLHEVEEYVEDATTMEVGGSDSSGNMLRVEDDDKVHVVVETKNISPVKAKAVPVLEKAKNKSDTVINKKVEVGPTSSEKVMATDQPVTQVPYEDLLVFEKDTVEKVPIMQSNEEAYVVDADFTPVAKIAEPQKIEIPSMPIATFEAIKPEKIVYEDAPIQTDSSTQAEEHVQDLTIFSIPTIVTAPDTPDTMEPYADIDLPAKAIHIQEASDIEPIAVSHTLQEVLLKEEEALIVQPSQAQDTYIQAIEPVEAASIVETVTTLTDTVPDVLATVEPQKVYDQAEVIIQKINVFETLTTAEECRDAVDGLRGELELLLAHIGYTDAGMIAMNLLKQHDTKTLVEYMTLLKRGILQTHSVVSAPRRILRAIMPYHRYGTHAVRSTVTSYA